MTEREEIDLLRRLVVALTERVEALEARPTVHAPVPLYTPIWPPSPTCTPGLPERPYTGWPLPPSVIGVGMGSPLPEVSQTYGAIS